MKKGDVNDVNAVKHLFLYTFVASKPHLWSFIHFLQLIFHLCFEMPVFSRSFLIYLTSRMLRLSRCAGDRSRIRKFTFMHCRPAGRGGDGCARTPPLSHRLHRCTFLLISRFLKWIHSIPIFKFKDCVVQLKILWKSWQAWLMHAFHKTYFSLR